MSIKMAEANHWAKIKRRDYQSSRRKRRERDRERSFQLSFGESSRGHVRSEGLIF